MKKKDKESESKNFCELCGLKIKIEETSKDIAEQTEERFKKLTALGLRKRKRYRRHISDSVGASSDISFVEFCAIGSKKWIKKGKGCKDFQLKRDTLNLSDYISIQSSERIARKHKKLLIIAIIVSIATLLYLIFPSEIKGFFTSLFSFIFN